MSAAKIMSTAKIKHLQSGFSLVEMLCTLVLFGVVMAALLGYHRALQQSFQAQWELRQVWRWAMVLSEPEPPDIPPGWQVTHKQTTVADCIRISVEFTSPSGRTGQLSRLHCPLIISPLITVVDNKPAGN